MFYPADFFDAPPQRYALYQCPRCHSTDGREPPPNDESGRECRLCTGSMVLRLDQISGEVEAVLMPN